MILIRWPVVLVRAWLILFRSRSVPIGWLFDAGVVLYALSNAALYFVEDAAFRRRGFTYLMVGLDILALTASLIINGHSEANFFLAYFLLIIVCCMFESGRMIAAVSMQGWY